MIRRKRMSDYVIMTDSASDLSQDVVDEIGVGVLPLKFTLEDKEYRDLPDGSEIDIKYVYSQMRAGKQVLTAAVNIDDARAAMEEKLEQGLDIFWMAFSSALSSTYQNTCAAADMLRDKYPERKIIVIDTKCASLGQGLYVYLAAKKKEEGLTIDQLNEWAEDIKLHMVHWFTVDDLFHLKRGGRVSAATALVGSMLGIKPVMHVDDMGRLINMSKARGRRASINAMFEHMRDTAVEPEKQTVFICHGDCIEDAEYLSDLVKSELGVRHVYINYTGPVIGAHSGPGTLALFFIGTER